MKIRFNVEMDDMVAFNNHYLRTSPYMRRQRLFFTAVLWVICLVMGSFSMRKGHPFDMVSFIFFAAVGSLWFYRISQKVNPKRLARMYAGEKNKGSLGEIEMEVLTDGVCERTSVGEKKTYFAGIERIDTTDSHVYIFTGTMMAYVIPRDKVIEGDLDMFLSMLREKMRSVEPVQTVGS